MLSLKMSQNSPKKFLKAAPCNHRSAYDTDRSSSPLSGATMFHEPDPRGEQSIDQFVEAWAETKLLDIYL